MFNISIKSAGRFVPAAMANQAHRASQMEPRNEGSAPIAHEDLPEGILPDSDALKGLHIYASRFYEALGKEDAAATAEGRLLDERSMDETALLALGILLEEAGRDALGRRGDMVFTEGLVPEAAESTLRDTEGSSGQPSASRDPRPTELAVGFSEGGTFWKRSLAKRRKVGEDPGGERGPASLMMQDGQQSD